MIKVEQLAAFGTFHGDETTLFGENKADKATWVIEQRGTKRPARYSVVYEVGDYHQECLAYGDKRLTLVMAAMVAARTAFTEAMKHGR